MKNTRKKLERMDMMESRNLQRIAEFDREEWLTEHRRERLAYIEGYTTAKPGCEEVREQIINRYRHELDLDKED